MGVPDATDRARRGSRLRSDLLSEPQPPPTTPLQVSWRDFVFAEVWARPGLDMRARFWTSIVGAAYGMGELATLDTYIRGALTREILTVAELCEAALHVAVYAGWSRGDHLEAAVARVVRALGRTMPEAPLAPSEAEAMAQRQARGAAGFEAIMTFPITTLPAPLFDAGNLSFVFPEMWTRDGLDIRSRRWISLVCSTEAGSDVAVRSHLYAALKRGDATADELQEFVLQYAVHGGWPRASMLQACLLVEMAKVAEGRSFQ